MSALTILPCLKCESPGKVQRMGVGYMVVPKRIKNCDLHKHPEPRCGGRSVAVCCRSGWCPTREEAVRQWNQMMQPTDSKKAL